MRGRDEACRKTGASRISRSFQIREKDQGNGPHGCRRAMASAVDSGFVTRAAGRDRPNSSGRMLPGMERPRSPPSSGLGMPLRSRRGGRGSRAAIGSGFPTAPHLPDGRPAVRASAVRASGGMSGGRRGPGDDVEIEHGSSPRLEDHPGAGTERRFSTMKPYFAEAAFGPGRLRCQRRYRANLGRR